MAADMSQRDDLPSLQREYLERCIASLRDGRLIAAKDQANVAKALSAMLAYRSPPKEAAQDMVMREALVAIKAMVCGDKNPRWSGDGAIFATRARIADICDRALAAAPSAVDVPRELPVGEWSEEEYHRQMSVEDRPNWNKGGGR